MSCYVSGQECFSDSLAFIEILFRSVTGMLSEVDCYRGCQRKKPGGLSRGRSPSRLSVGGFYRVSAHHGNVRIILGLEENQAPRQLHQLGAQTPIARFGNAQIRRASTGSADSARQPGVAAHLAAVLEALPVADFAFHVLMSQASHPLQETLRCVGFDLLTQLAHGLIHRQDQWPEDLPSLDQPAVQL